MPSDVNDDAISIVVLPITTLIAMVFVAAFTVAYASFFDLLLAISPPLLEVVIHLDRRTVI